MTLRVCLEPGCPVLVKQGRCTAHQRVTYKARDKARGTRQARGYDAQHERERAIIQRAIDSGEVVDCWCCGVQLLGRAWHLDHTKDRTGYRGPACIPCNLELAGRGL